MIRVLVRILSTAVLIGLCMLAAACGGDDGDGDAATDAQQGAADEPKRGGKLTQLGATDVDKLDSGYTYYAAGLQVMAAIARGLYYFEPGEETEATPDLAASDPLISDDNKTVTIKLREGVRFSPPVDREVQAKDVKYALERIFSANVGGQYTAYYADLVGTPAAPTKGVKPIEGIEVSAEDQYTIVFRLREPTGPSFAAALSMPATAPVPEEYAKAFDAESPSTYNTHFVATGPYMVRNDASGELVGYQPGKSIELVRNPNWSAATDFRPAYLDEVLLRTNASEATVAGRQVLEGQGLALDADPPASILRRAVQRYEDQLITLPSGGVRYLPINTTIKPFDDVDVRRAVVAGFDRDAARKARGGEFVGPIANHFLPPGIGGHEEAGGLEGFGFDFLENPRGDAALAAEYMKKAGYRSGAYDGEEEFLMVGANVDPGKAQAEVARAQLEELGFKIRLRTLPQDAVYTEWCQAPAKKVAFCASAGWFKDFPDPQGILQPIFKGSEINLDGANNNVSQLDVPEIDEAMTRAAGLAGQERFEAWAEVDRMITDVAAAVPLLWDATNLIHSEDVAGVGNAMFNSIDFSYTSLK
jgi:peptide/nickel transport system substrate-binding protein